MDCAVKSKHGRQGRGKPNHDGCPHAAPAAAIVELCKHDFGTGPRRKDPEGNDNDEEADDVKNQQQSFNQRQLLRRNGVEKDCKGCNGHDEQRPMPGLRRICFLLVQNYQSLDDAPDHERNRNDSALPPDGTKPS